MLWIAVFPTLPARNLRYPAQRSSAIRLRSATIVSSMLLASFAAGDVQGLQQMLAADVVLVSDGGGEIKALAGPVYGRAKVLPLVSKLYEAYRDVTRTSLQVLNGEPAILIHRSNAKSGHASFFTMHCELDETLHMRRLHFCFCADQIVSAKTTKPIALMILIRVSTVPVT